MRLNVSHPSHRAGPAGRKGRWGGSRFFVLAAASAFCTLIPDMSYSQRSLPGSPVQPDPDRKEADPAKTVTVEPHDKRIFGIIPNYRTSPSLQNYVPLSAADKFKIASKDAFDRGTFIMAAAFAGEAQMTDSNPSFGQGMRGYAHSFATSTADFVVGDFMTEAIFPALLHQDPRYFRRGSGSGWSRFGYAAGQIFWTHTDSGGSQFNFSEIVGNSAAVAISNAYYPDNRTASDATVRLAIQIAVDMTGNILKEFWPDLNRKFSRRPRNATP